MAHFVEGMMNISVVINARKWRGCHTINETQVEVEVGPNQKNIEIEISFEDGEPLPLELKDFLNWIDSGMVPTK